MARIVVLGTLDWMLDHVREQLRAGGHEVLSCHFDNGPAFPCVGLAGASPCPMDEADLVLSVRSHPLPQPTRREIGVTCGLRRGLPLIVVGRTMLNPFESFASAVVDDLEEVLPTVDAVLGRVDSPPAI
ncbi:MAG: hypothetical protein N2037_12220 [Acidimicrobiales bacterium]|nr:hypothetical protein [Acidimicrobiales bacterium]